MAVCRHEPVRSEINLTAGSLSGTFWFATGVFPDASMMSSSPFNPLRFVAITAFLLFFYHHLAIDLIKSAYLALDIAYESKTGHALKIDSSYQGVSPQDNTSAVADLASNT